MPTIVEIQSVMQKYNLVVCGGTFEYLHKGHQSFLRFALSKGKKILLGLTTDAYIHRTLKSTKSSYASRKQELEQFLKDEKAIDRVEILPIEDIYIPELWEHLPIEAIIVTVESLRGAEMINKKREKEGLGPLVIEIAPLVITADGKRLSSSLIRNTYGKTETLVLPSDIRQELKKPLGTLIDNFEEWLTKHRHSLQPAHIITVGDVVTKSCNAFSLMQRISVIDFKVERKTVFSNIEELSFSGTEERIVVFNRPATLTSDLFEAVKNILTLSPTKRIVLRIDGEEDLAVLPLMLFAPLGYSIFYGQPGEGVVHVSISEQSKKMAESIIKQFTKVSL